MSVVANLPRLPSPPTPTEIQIGSKGALTLASSDHEKVVKEEERIIEENSQRRIHPGTRSANMAAGPPIVPITELDSAFQLQEHLMALHYGFSRSPNNASSQPISRANAQILANPPAGVDRALWLYELCRLIINKCNDLIVGFLFDTPPCSATICPEMRASEWQFLCAVHESPKPCCAIDYCCHTLDWATNVVTSQTLFPSRLSLGTGDLIAEGNAGVKHLANIFRRLHRIFAHAWFQHREVYWSVESSTGLYTLFKIVCDAYDLIPADNYKLPPEAEGLESAAQPVISILKPNLFSSFPLADEGKTIDSIGRTKTRRHIRKSPSVGSEVTTVLEFDEDQTLKQGLEDLSQEVRESEVEDSLIDGSPELDKNSATTDQATDEAAGAELMEISVKEDVLKVSGYSSDVDLSIQSEPKVEKEIVKQMGEVDLEQDEAHDSSQVKELDQVVGDRTKS